MIRQEILLETLLFVSIKPGKIRLVIGKNTGHQFDIRAVIVGRVLIPRLANLAVSPTPLFFTWRNMVVGNVQQTAIFIVTPRADKSYCDFSAIYEVGTAHFYSEKCPLRRSSPLCSKCRWRWGKRRRPVCRDQTPQSHPVENSMPFTPFHCRVGPPQEMTRRGVAVIDAAGDFQCRPVRAQGEPVITCKPCIGSVSPTHTVCAPSSWASRVKSTGIKVVGRWCCGQLNSIRRRSTVPASPPAQV